MARIILNVPLEMNLPNAKAHFALSQNIPLAISVSIGFERTRRVICNLLLLKTWLNGTGTNNFYSPPFENTHWIIAMRAKACSKWKYLSRHLLTPQFGVQLNVKGSANWHPHLVTSIIRQTVIDKCGAEVEFGKFKLFTNSRVDWNCKF